MKLGIASPQRTLLDVRREPVAPTPRPAAQRLRDVRATYQRKRLAALLRAMARHFATTIVDRDKKGAA